MTGRSVQTTTKEAKPRANRATTRDPLTPASDSGERVRQLHGVIGNQAVGPMLRAKLGVNGPHAGPVPSLLDAHGLSAGRSEPSVSRPNDELEREADRVADLATRDLSVSRSTDAATVAKLGAIFGRDFGRVRIHTGVEPAHAARALNAEAFTVQQDIFLGNSDGISSNQMRGRLLAHELTHVVHNNQAPARPGGARIHVSGRTSAPGAILRAVTPKYATIEDNLTYGFADWAITDNQALEVMVILAYLSEEDFQDTVQRMEADGLVERLLDNFPEEYRDTFANTIRKIQGARSTSGLTIEIEDLMSYGFFDWAITDAEAHRVLETLKDLRAANPAKFKQVVRVIEGKYFERFLNQVSDEDRAANKDFLDEVRTLRATGLTREDARNAVEAYAALFAEEDRKKKFEKDYPTGRVSNMLRALAPADAAGKYQDQVRELLRWIEEAETRAAAGMSDEEIEKLQSEFMVEQDEKRAREKKKKEADEKKKDEKGKGEEKKPELKPTQREPTEEEVAQAHQENVAESGIPDTPESEKKWNKLEKKPSEAQKWEKRADRVIATVVKHINKKYPELKVTKDNLKADFKAIEDEGDVYAFQRTGPKGEQVCVFGMKFVEDAEADPDYVVATVVHETIGHPEFGTYGTEYHLKLYDAAAAKMKGYTRPAEGSEERDQEYHTFAYQGTEIYAVLRSAPYYREVTPEHQKKGVVSGDPGWEIQVRLQKIRERWHPKLARALARGLYQRYRNDPRITPASLKLYEDAVRAEFGEHADAILK